MTGVVTLIESLPALASIGPFREIPAPTDVVWDADSTPVVVTTGSEVPAGIGPGWVQVDVPHAHPVPDAAEIGPNMLMLIGPGASTVDGFDTVAVYDVGPPAVNDADPATSATATSHGGRTGCVTVRVSLSVFQPPGETVAVTETLVAAAGTVPAIKTDRKPICWKE